LRIANVKQALRPLLFGTIISGMTPLGAQVSCPGELSDSRTVVTRVATAAEYSPSRRELSLPAVTRGDVRRLSDASDSNACQRINQILNARAPMADWRSHWTPVLYTAGGYFYAILVPIRDDTPAPPGTFKIDLRWTPLVVLKGDFTVVGTMAI
jgi:hypothetical protein